MFSWKRGAASWLAERRCPVETAPLSESTSGRSACNRPRIRSLHARYVCMHTDDKFRRYDQVKDQVKSGRVQRGIKIVCWIIGLPLTIGPTH